MKMPLREVWVMLMVSESVQEFGQMMAKVTVMMAQA